MKMSVWPTVSNIINLNFKRVYDKMQMRMRDRILNLKTTILMN